MQAWIRNGAKLAWLVDPYSRTVHVYSPEMETTTVTSVTLVGTGPVEGFTLDFARVWRRYEV
jgi:Uma2 family endonuclease